MQIVYLFPYVMTHASTPMYWTMNLFLSILVAGFVYEWWVHGAGGGDGWWASGVMWEGWGKLHASLSMSDMTVLDQSCKLVLKRVVAHVQRFGIFG